MKFNISYPQNGAQKTIDVDDELKCRCVYDLRMSQEFEGDELSEQFAGYRFRITGGFDKQGFPMKQGVLLPRRTRLLMKKGASCYRPRRTGERKRKSIRGCIVQSDIAVLSLVIVRKGDVEIPDITTVVHPRRRGPKRANNIRKLFNLSKDDDVRDYVVRREIPAKEGKKPQSKAPKIQRLVTPATLQRKRARRAARANRGIAAREAAQAYEDLLAKRAADAKKRRADAIAKKRRKATGAN